MCHGIPDGTRGIRQSRHQPSPTPGWAQVGGAYPFHWGSHSCGSAPQDHPEPPQNGTRTATATPIEPGAKPQTDSVRFPMNFDSLALSYRVELSVGHCKHRNELLSELLTRHVFLRWGTRRKFGQRPDYKVQTNMLLEISNLLSLSIST